MKYSVLRSSVRSSPLDETRKMFPAISQNCIIQWMIKPFFRLDSPAGVFGKATVPLVWARWPSVLSSGIQDYIVGAVVFTGLMIYGLMSNP